jgi:hypothetical protein
MAIDPALANQGATEALIEPMGVNEWINQIPNLRLQSFFESLAPPPEGQSLQETKLKNNVMMAPFGSAAPFTLTQPYSRVLSLNTEIQCTHPVTIESPVMIDGINFYSTNDLESEMVLVSGVGNSMFRNCTFVLTSDTALRSCVKVTSPAHVIFSGCYFIRELGSGGDAINNTAATVDVKVVGSIAVGYSDFGNTTDTASFV